MYGVYLNSQQVLFPNEEVVFLLARVIGMIGPIDTDMLIRGQETNKYFTDEFDLYHINEVHFLLSYNKKIDDCKTLFMSLYRFGFDAFRKQIKWNT